MSRTPHYPTRSDFDTEEEYDEAVALYKEYLDEQLDDAYEEARYSRL